MLVLARHQRQGDPYETLTEERSEELSSHLGHGLEWNSLCPPFAPVPGGGPQARHWKPLLLIWTALLMAWDGGVTLAEQFASARAAVTEMFPSRRRVGKSYQGFVGAMALSGAFWLDRLATQLRLQMRSMGSCWTVEGIEAFAVDGSRVECPRTAANQRVLKRAGRKKTGPQLSLTTMYHMGSGHMWDYRIGPGVESERVHLRAMLPTLPPGATLVADAGFIGYDLLKEILASGRHILFRVGANRALLQKLGYASVEDDSTVCLWPLEAQKHDQPPIVLRLMVLNDGRHPVYVVSDVLSEGALSLKQAGVLYRLRWGIEVFYRSLKQTLRHRTMRSRAPDQAKRELACAVMALWVLSLATAQAIVARGGHPRGLSIALARRQVRQAMAGRAAGNLTAKLAQCRKDTYPRSRSKTARNWPHKKNERPPGAPKIRAASPDEVQHAKELRERSRAA